MKVRNKQDAIEYLGAIRISPDTYAYWADEVGRWYVITPQELDALVLALKKDPRDGYSLWCTYTGREATAEEARRAEELS
jgi:hypothetical protein